MQKSFSKQFCKENNHIYLFLLILCVPLAWLGPSVNQVVGAVQQCSHNCTVAVMLGNPDQANGHMSAPSPLHVDHSFRRPTATDIPRLSWLGCGDIFQKSSGRIFVSIGLPVTQNCNLLCIQTPGTWCVETITCPRWDLTSIWCPGLAEPQALCYN